MPQHLTALGKMTAFYIPSHKLDVAGAGNDNSPRKTIHDFLIHNYRAYTHSPSPVKGFWISRLGVLTHDVLERFEVSFESETSFQELVAFLRILCHTLQEEAIYLTRGEESFLVNR